MSPIWTCATCLVRASYTDPNRADPPAGWTRLAGDWRCLACGREAAVGAALVAADPKAKPGRVKAEALARFELLRDPDRPDPRIAKAAGTFAAVVGSIRSELLAAGEIRPRTGGAKPKPAEPKPQPRRRRDRWREPVEAALRADPHRFNKVIAEQVGGCDPSTVGTTRRRLEQAGEIAVFDGRGGKGART